MNLTEMRAIVRCDLHDEDTANYRWSDDEIDRHITHTVREFSEAIPCEQRATLETTTGSREIDISSLTNRVMVQAVEYPTGRFPRSYQRFSLWADSICLLGDEIPDGSDAYIYYGKLHTLDESSSTVPATWKTSSPAVLAATPPWNGPPLPSTGLISAVTPLPGISWAGGRRSSATSERSSGDWAGGTGHGFLSSTSQPVPQNQKPLTTVLKQGVGDVGQYLSSTVVKNRRPALDLHPARYLAQA